jgi:peptidoglycan hydrolase-like protein with peptidoglycan-binding domain
MPESRISLGVRVRMSAGVAPSTRSGTDGGALDKQAAPTDVLQPAGATRAPRATTAATVWSSLLPRSLMHSPELSAVMNGAVLGPSEEPVEAVGLVQDRLNRIGDPFTIDVGTNRGYFGPKTQSALRLFQQAHALTPTGRIDATTVQALDAAVRLGKMPAAQHATVGGPAWILERPHLWENVTAPTGTFREGDSGDAVKWVQARLGEYGFSTIGDEDGTFGPVTERMLSSFQAWNGLDAAGVADARTIELLSRQPEKTAGGKARLEGGVSLTGLTEKQKLQYLRKLYDLNNAGGVARNRDPGGVNFVQIRGFAEGHAVQNVPNKYNDTIFALINDLKGEPMKVVELIASADYGDQFAELEAGYGVPRPYDPTLGPVMGEESFLGQGLVNTAPGRVIEYALGPHRFRGLALVDPEGEHRAQAFTDFNHNGQIDGGEWNHPTTERVANNTHHGAPSSAGDVGEFSAGCNTLPTDGAYQRFVDLLLRSGQVAKYLKSHPGEEAAISGAPRTDGIVYLDGPKKGEPLPMGPASTLHELRFPFAMVDSRSLPDPASAL